MRGDTASKGGGRIEPRPEVGRHASTTGRKSRSAARGLSLLLMLRSSLFAASFVVVDAGRPAVAFAADAAAPLAAASSVAVDAGRPAVA